VSVLIFRNPENCMGFIIRLNNRRSVPKGFYQVYSALHLAVVPVFKLDADPRPEALNVWWTGVVKKF
jgi:hypothetical protein